MEAMGFDENNMTSCVGVTAPTPPPGVSHEGRKVVHSYGKEGLMVDRVVGRKFGSDRRM